MYNINKVMVYYHQGGTIHGLWLCEAWPIPLKVAILDCLKSQSLVYCKIDQAYLKSVPNFYKEEKVDTTNQYNPIC
mgnify:CR=1 FL=1